MWSLSFIFIFKTNGSKILSFISTFSPIHTFSYIYGLNRQKVAWVILLCSAYFWLMYSSIILFMIKLFLDLRIFYSDFSYYSKFISSSNLNKLCASGVWIASIGRQAKVLKIILYETLLFYLSASFSRCRYGWINWSEAILFCLNSSSLSLK